MHSDGMVETRREGFDNNTKSGALHNKKNSGNDVTQAMDGSFAHVVREVNVTYNPKDEDAKLQGMRISSPRSAVMEVCTKATPRQLVVF